MSDKDYKIALKILALVDECPSEPFSFERKQIEGQISDLIGQHTQSLDDERDVSYQLGNEDGYSEGYQEATDEFHSTIQDLEAEISQLKDDQESKWQDAFTEGYESARVEYGLN